MAAPSFFRENAELSENCCSYPVGTPEADFYYSFDLLVKTEHIVVDLTLHKHCCGYCSKPGADVMILQKKIGGFCQKYCQCLLKLCNNIFLEKRHFFAEKRRKSLKFISDLHFYNQTVHRIENCTLHIRYIAYLTSRR
jgi:hypothetical protein